MKVLCEQFGARDGPRPYIGIFHFFLFFVIPPRIKIAHHLIISEWVYDFDRILLQNTCYHYKYRPMLSTTSAFQTTANREVSWMSFEEKPCKNATIPAFLKHIETCRNITTIQNVTITKITNAEAEVVADFLEIIVDGIRLFALTGSHPDRTRFLKVFGTLKQI